jgi:L-asparaginase
MPLEPAPQSGPAAPVVGVFSLGGTIAMTADAVARGVVPRLTAADLVASVPGLAAGGIQVRTCDVRGMPGASLGFADVLALLEAIEREVASGAVTGAVVTQGTDTIEETSWLLDLLYTGDAPIVVTGAMRNPTMAGADGPANVLAAVLVAASPAASGLGVLVAFADDVFSAGDVRKTHATSVTAFASSNSGPIGHVSEGIVRIRCSPHRPHVVGAADARERLNAVRVVVVPMTLGQDDTALGALAGRVDGLVVAAFGVGHVPDGVVGALTELAARIPVILASRTGAGTVAAATYAFPGSESDLLARGLIRAGYLDPYKARILLQVLLAAGAEDAGIRRTFAVIGGYADPP